jgi:hypothetical protein
MSGARHAAHRAAEREAADGDADFWRSGDRAAPRSRRPKPEIEPEWEPDDDRRGDQIRDDEPDIIWRTSGVHPARSRGTRPRRWAERDDDEPQIAEPERPTISNRPESENWVYS